MVPSNFRAIVMIGIAESKIALHPLVHTLHIFQEVYHIQPPSRNTRKEVSVPHVTYLRRLDTKVLDLE